MEGSHAMTCEEVIRSEIVEEYLLDQLSEEARDSFEQHYFECGRCFGLLQTYRDVQAELARTREAGLLPAPRRNWVWRWAWAPAMAVVLMVVSLALWKLPITEIPGPPSQDIQPTAPTPPPAESVSPSLPPSSPPKPSLDDLARVEPPSYAPSRLRGTADEATARFQEAMKHYQRRDYPAAIAGLRAASNLDPEAPHILFFLGISHLLAGESDTAIEVLRKTIALGDSPYIEDSHFYLAKAYLQKGNIDEATRQLEITTRLRGAPKAGKGGKRESRKRPG